MVPVWKRGKSVFEGSGSRSGVLGCNGCGVLAAGELCSTCALPPRDASCPASLSEPSGPPAGVSSVSVLESLLSPIGQGLCILICLTQFFYWQHCDTCTVHVTSWCKQKHLNMYETYISIDYIAHLEILSRNTVRSSVVC